MLRRADRVLTITYLSGYHVVLRQPPGRRTDIEYRVSDVKSVTRSVSGPRVGSLLARVLAMLRPHYIERAGS